MSLPRSSPKVTILIDPSSAHPGAGAFIVDDAFSDEFLAAWDVLWPQLPVAEEAEGTCSERRYYCDAMGWGAAHINAVLESVGVGVRRVFPYMRILNYPHVDGRVAAHVDLFREDVRLGRSSHTFLLYLATCERGGETMLLEKTSNCAKVMAAIQPRRGRLLVFPHLCPHKGDDTISLPKVLLRGEMV